MMKSYCRKVIKTRGIEELFNALITDVESPWYVASVFHWGEDIYFVVLEREKP